MYEFDLCDQLKLYVDMHDAQHPKPNDLWAYQKHGAKQQLVLQLLTQRLNDLRLPKQHR